MEFLRVKKSALSLDMAPMIDIVFQLLIFFMLTLSFASPAIKLNLPKAIEHDIKQPEKIVVSIDKSANIFVNAQKVRMSNLGIFLAEKLNVVSEKSIHIRGDEEMPYRLFVEVMDIARRAGASQINIVHKPGKSQ